MKTKTNVNVLKTVIGILIIVPFVMNYPQSIQMRMDVIAMRESMDLMKVSVILIVQVKIKIGTPKLKLAIVRTIISVPNATSIV